ncbi:MAG: type II secretion system protein [Phycisphaerae bacterium]
MSCSKKWVHPRRRGFTLIELLVVVAIIAVLIAILLPSLGKARERAKVAQCLNNVKQLAMSTRMYITDQQTKYISTYQDKSVGVYMWLTALLPYGNVDKVRLCPSASIPVTDGGNAPPAGTASLAWSGTLSHNDGGNLIKSMNAPGQPFQGYPTPQYWAGSYGENAWLFNPYDPKRKFDSGPKKYPDEFVPWPAPVTEARVPVFFDSVWSDSWPGYTNVSNNYKKWDQVPVQANGMYNPDGSNIMGNTNARPGNGDKYMARLCIDRHSNHSINMSYMDGHADNVKLNDLWNQQWSVNYQRPTHPATDVPNWNKLPQ